MSLKSTVLKIGLAASLLSGAQTIDAREDVTIDQHSFPNMVSASFHSQIDKIMLASTCDTPSVQIDYDKQDGQIYMQTLHPEKEQNAVTASISGTLTRVHIRCGNGSTETIGDRTMPISSAQRIEIHSNNAPIAEISQQALTYSLVAFPEVTVQIDKHHSALPFQKLSSLEHALESIKQLGLQSPLRKISIRRLDVVNAFAEEAQTTNSPDEIVLSEQMLEEFSEEELAIVLRHEMYHLLLENNSNSLFDGVKAEIIQAINTLSSEQKEIFSHKVNESLFYSNIFPKKHQKEPSGDHELPVMFFNTQNSELPSLKDSPEAYKKAALELIEQLSTIPPEIK